MTSEVPEGWVKTTLGNTNYFQILGSGIKYFQGTKEYLSTSSVENDKIVMVEEIITHKDRPSRANMQPVTNSAWFAKMKATLKVLAADERLIEKNILSTGFCGILSTKVDSRYLKQFLLDEKFNIIKDSKTEGTTQEAINNEKTSKIEIIFPKDPKEQEKIVNVLQTIDNNIENTKSLIEKHQKMKQGLMLNLINNGLGGKRKKVLLGKIWKKIKRGPSLSTNLQGKGVVYLTSDNLTEDNHLNMSELKHLDNFYKHDCIIEFEDVIINCVNSEDRIGKTAFYDLHTNNVIVGFNNFALTFNGSVNSKYMYYLLSGFEFQKQMKQRTKPAVNQVSFSGSDIYKIEVEIPKDIDEQKKIVNILDSIDNKIITREIVLQKLLKMKTGLMQDLLTGKVGVAA